MNDYGLSVLPRYGLSAESQVRVRGALLCRTKDGLRLISEVAQPGTKLELCFELEEQIADLGLLQCDRLLRNEEGKLVTAGEDGRMYLVRCWYPGKECSPTDREDLVRAADALARLHNTAHLPWVKEYQKESLIDEWGRHNRELRRIRKYLKGKKNRNEFEKYLFACSDSFLAYGEETLEKLAASSYEKLRERALRNGSICHGACNQHNILLEKGGEETIVNFEHWSFDVPMADLALFVRKILEKNSWNPKTADLVLNAYSARRPLENEEVEHLMLRLAYPWKYWKIANRYYGNRKVWISAGNLEKLKRLREQEKEWQSLVRNKK